MKLIVVGSWFGVDKVFQDMFGATVKISNMKDLHRHKGWFDSRAVVLFGGGEDISPSLYGQEPTKYTYASKKLSQRDAFELEVFKVAKSANSKFIGVCRGAQFLCALAGGSLYQHVDNHGMTHNMETNEGTVLKVSSAHHQMMNPKGTNHLLLAWSDVVRSARHIVEGGLSAEVDVEPEVVLFPEINALAIQYHPEFMHPTDSAVKYSRDLVKKYLMGA